MRISHSRPLLGTLAEAAGALLRPRTSLQKAVAITVAIKIGAIIALNLALHFTAPTSPRTDAGVAKHFFSEAARAAPTFGRA